MRVSIGVRRAAALVALVVLLAVPAAYADDEFPYEPPEARIRPPIGSSQTEPSFFELFLDWLVIYARIRPPIG